MSENSIRQIDAGRSLEGRAERLERFIARSWGRTLTSPTAFDSVELQKFSVRRATSDEDIATVRAHREKKYGSGVAPLAPDDLAAHSELLIAFAPDGVAVASTRFSVDLNNQNLLTIQRFTKVPESWARTSDGHPARLSEAMRTCNLGRTRKEQLHAKLALWRAIIWRCEDLRIDWQLILVRPPMNTDFRMFNCKPPNGVPFWVTPPDYALEHELLALDLHDYTSQWRQPSHWMYPVFCRK
jgi:hypothetical protein